MRGLESFVHCRHWCWVDVEVRSPSDTLPGAGAELGTPEVERTGAVLWAVDFFFVGAWDFLVWGSLEDVGSSVCEDLRPFLFVESCACTGWVVLPRLPPVRLFLT